MFRQLEEIAQDASYDIVVVGSGVAGMSAAFFAALERQRPSH
jgi:succinate dehydrogenase/fumarate reductase flavoprotein subunit